MSDFSSPDCIHSWGCDTAVFRVGVGESDNDRRDAFTVMKSGKVLINGREAKLKPQAGETEGARRLDEKNTELKAELDAANAKIAALEAKQAELEQMIAVIAVHVGHAVAPSK